MLSRHDLIHFGVEFYSRFCRGLILKDLVNLAMLLMSVFPSQRFLVLTPTFCVQTKLFQNFQKMWNEWSTPEIGNDPDEVQGDPMEGSGRKK